MRERVFVQVVVPGWNVRADAVYTGLDPPRQ